MSATAITEISDAVRGIGSVIRVMRERAEMSLDDLSSKVSKGRRDVHIGPRTIELVEDGGTDAQLDHMLYLLAAVGLDMRLPGSAATSAARMPSTRMAEIRTAIFRARHPEGMRKISFKALSDVAGIEQGQIGKIESGEAMPRFRTVLALTRALGIQVRFVGIGDPVRGAPRAATMRRGRSRPGKGAETRSAS